MKTDFMRVDRGLTLHVFQRFCRTRAAHLPILMYHSVSEDSEPGVGPYYRVTTSPQRFSEQMRWLSESGYVGVSLEDALLGGHNLTGGRRPVAITFDDGFRDFYTAAWPTLTRYNFTATMYLPTGFIRPRRTSCLGRECLNWNEVRNLRKQGVQFGSHTVTHPKLYGMPWSGVEKELSDSKSDLEQELGEAISSFAFPFAFPQEDRFFAKQLTNTLQSVGYSNCVTTVVGRANTKDNPFLLNRLPVNDCDDRALFTAKISGAYDWMGAPQLLIRQVKGWVRSARQNGRVNIGC